MFDLQLTSVHASYEMEWKEVKSLNFDTTDEHFWRCLSIWIQKPFFYCRNCGGVDLFLLDGKNDDKFTDYVDILTGILKTSSITNYKELKNCLREIQGNEILIEIPQTFFDDMKIKINKRFIILRILYPKKGDFHANTAELITLDMKNNSAVFTKPLQNSNKPLFSYKICYDGISLVFSTHPNFAGSDEIKKLSEILSNKIPLWVKSELKNQICSLQLVSTEAYLVLYNELKKKYIESIKKIWTESTDADKVVHQAVSIATYLLLLWGDKIQRFVDLGCGSGLLVHILNSERHDGVGIDVRSRKIWSHYPSTTVLKTTTISPSDEYLFPEADWIIGNHSDELTPWIPVISARSSYKTNFFLLPCCSYDFSGKKYIRNNTNKSQYMDYLDYVENICSVCGFKVDRDRLRIPSTKRICFVSKGRIYKECEKEKINNNIKNLLNHFKTNSNENRNSEDNNWLNDFKPREAIEKVRNCTKLNKDLVSEIVDKVADIILQSNSTDSWNEGSFVKLSSIAEQLPKESLRQLKKECGGLQTLLRNNRFIFLVEKGQVKFRKPIEKNPRPSSWKLKPCWFYDNHPQSCPLDDEKCSFIHFCKDQ